MHSRFDHFRTTPLGAQLEALIARPERYIEFAVLSRVGMAAIAAIADEAARKFPEIEQDATARQFCGAMVAEVMRLHHHEVVRARGRVGGHVFSYGAVFSPYPGKLPLAEVIAMLARMPQTLSETVARIPERRWLQRPEGAGFALVEQACHLRDLDAVFAERIHAVQTVNLPVIDSVNGSVLAIQRNYLHQDLQYAVATFSQSRLQLCSALATLSAESLARCGLRDGIRRMSLEELARELLDHDRAHALELDQLGAALELSATSEPA